MQKNKEKTFTIKDKWQQEFYKQVVEAILEIRNGADVDETAQKYNIDKDLLKSLI